MSPLPSERPSPPGDRDQALEIAGQRGRSIYEFVRSTLNGLEEAAPWRLLYYPPDEDREFLEICRRLVERIDVMPDHLETLAGALLDDANDEATRHAVEDIRFYFDGIQMMTGGEIAKLHNRITHHDSEPEEGLPPEERAELLEIAADLKGKYASSIMGAAASLIAEDRWSGVELEPVLFPEKAEEFKRNEHLVETLNTVLHAIDALRPEVPLPDLAQTWSQEKKVDQYALMPLYAFLGMLGKLMKESARRALYSGDYHQIRKRESQLNTRINELNTLHNMTWGTVPIPEGADLGKVFRRLERMAIEIAAILDLDLLKQSIGEPAVKDLHMVVVTEKEKVRKVADLEKRRALAVELRARLPEGHRALVPLLYEEDLRAFLDLLLGSVMKRASLAVTKMRKENQAAASEPSAPKDDPTPPPVEVLDVEPDLLEPEENPAFETPMAFETSVDFDSSGSADVPILGGGDGLDFGLPEEFDFEPLPHLDEPTLPKSASSSPTEFVQQASDEDRVNALKDLEDALREVLARGNSRRRPVELLQRLLDQGKNVPPGMVQSIHPFLNQIGEDLQPRVRVATMVAGLPAAAADNLQKTCEALKQRPDPNEIHTTVAANVERLIHLLEGLDSTVAAMVRKERALS